MAKFEEHHRSVSRTLEFSFWAIRESSQELVTRRGGRFQRPLDLRLACVWEEGVNKFVVILFNWLLAQEQCKNHANCAQLNLYGDKKCNTNNRRHVRIQYYLYTTYENHMIRMKPEYSQWSSVAKFESFKKSAWHRPGPDAPYETQRKHYQAHHQEESSGGL